MIKLTKSILYKYTVGEDIANAISHGVSAIFAYVGLIYLVYTSAINGSTIDVIAFSIYGTSLLFMFLMSTLYHAIFHDMTRSIFKRLDHSAIFVLIAGTYVPFTFTVINDLMSYIILGVLVLIAILGIVLKTFFVGRFKVVSTLVYVFMGWLIIFEIKPLISNLSQNALIFLVAGGVIYTLGAIIYAISKFKYHHFVWHIFVTLAAICHYIVIAFYIF